MVRGPLSLNTQPYALRPLREDSPTLIERVTLEQDAPAFSLSGQQSPNRVTNRNLIYMPVPIYGLGKGVINPGPDGVLDPRDLLRFWSSEDVMTHWSTQMTLALLEEDSSGDGDPIRGAVHFKGNIVVVGENLTGSTRAIVTDKFTGSTATWEGGGQLTIDQLTEVKVAGDIQAPNDLYIIAAGKLVSTDAQTTIQVHTSADNSTWTRRQGYDVLLNVPTINENIDIGLVCPREIGGEVVIAIWDETNAKITLRSTTDKFGSVNVNELSIASGGGPKGIAAMRGTDGKDKLFLGTREGVYEIDTSASTWTASLLPADMAPHDDNCRRMIVHNGALWVPVGVGNGEAAHMLRIVATEQGYIIAFDVTLDGIFIGLGAGDGVPTTMLGPIRWMWSAQGLLFASVGGGAASRNAMVMVHNGLGWHPVRKNQTANEKYRVIFVSGDDDGATRLHYEEITSATVSAMKFLTLPLSNPNDGQAYKFEANGLIYRPEINLDLPHENKAFLRISVDGVGFGTTSTEYENIDYLLDGAGGTPTDLSNFVSGDLRVPFASGAGVAGTSIQIVQNLFRTSGDSSLTLKDRRLTIEVRVIPSKIEGFTFLVDIDASAELIGVTPGAVVANLQTADALTILNAFLAPIFSGTKYVEVASLQFFDQFDVETSDEDISNTRGGTALLTVKEVL